MKKIILVDDDVFFGHLVQDVLTDYEVVYCQDAVMAINQLDETKPDAMILDLLMPGATGFSLLQEVISDPIYHNLPIIICSSAVSEIDGEFFESIGIGEILDKNQIKPDDIQASLKRLGL